MIVRAEVGVVQPHDLNGVMLGGLPGQVYKEKEMQLEDEDLVFFYTDGIVESQNSKGEMFKLDRLVRILEQHGHKSAAEIETIVVDHINLFTEGLPQKDDITMVVLKAGKEQTEITSFNSPIVCT